MIREAGRCVVTVPAADQSRGYVRPVAGESHMQPRARAHDRAASQYVDDRYFPLVVVTFPEHPDLEFAEAFIREAERPITRREPKVTLIDASRTRSLSTATVRHRLGTWAQGHE